jgi:hypothetical protein
LAGPVATIRAVAPVRLLAFDLSGGAFFLGFRRSAISAAAGSALSKRGARGQQGDGDPGGDTFRFHDFGLV